mgnify:CR=1 FL=1
MKNSPKKKTKQNQCRCVDYDNKNFVCLMFFVGMIFFFKMIITDQGVREREKDMHYSYHQELPEFEENKKKIQNLTIYGKDI